LKSPNNATVLRDMLQGGTIKAGELRARGTRGRGWFGISHVSAMENVSNIFGLAKMKAIRGAADLNAKEVAQGAQVFNWELMLHAGDESLDDLRMSTCDNNVININE